MAQERKEPLWETKRTFKWLSISSGIKLEILRRAFRTCISCFSHHLTFWPHFPTLTPLLPALLWSLNSSNSPSFLFFFPKEFLCYCHRVFALAISSVSCVHMYDSITFFRTPCKSYCLKSSLIIREHSFHLSFFMLRIHHFLTNIMPICLILLSIFPHFSHECLLILHKLYFTTESSRLQIVT